MMANFIFKLKEIIMKLLTLIKYRLVKLYRFLLILIKKILLQRIQQIQIIQKIRSLFLIEFQRIHLQQQCLYHLLQQ